MPDNPTAWRLNMRITKVEILRNREPVRLPEPWKPSWIEPNGKPRETLQAAFYKVHTDEGVTGMGPATGYPDLAELVGFDPFHVGAFWADRMSRRDSETFRKGGAGLEIAMWDIIGQAAGLPLYKLLGARTDRVQVYAATTRLLEKSQQVEQAQQIIAEGFSAIKLRMHRPDPRDDLAVVAAVREAIGDDVMLLVDANQNNKSEGYTYWSRGTALQIAEELDKLHVYYMEDPLPNADIEGLAAIASSVKMHIAGGEHLSCVYDFKEPVVRNAYDIIQPDIAMTGNIGVAGLQHLAAMADFFGKALVPHVIKSSVLDLAATLHTMAAVTSCPLVEFTYDPPILTADTTQSLLKDPLWIDDHGAIVLPDQPGLGVALYEEKLIAD